MISAIPKKTIVFAPFPGTNNNWWHMGSTSGKPAMQIAGSFYVTNITNGDILLTVAKIKKPKILGHVMVVNSGVASRDSIPPGETTEMTFDLWINPPCREKGEEFVTDVAILDQYSNHHWIKKIKFSYR